MFGKLSDFLQVHTLPLLLGCPSPWSYPGHTQSFANMAWDSLQFLVECFASCTISEGGSCFLVLELSKWRAWKFEPKDLPDRASCNLSLWIFNCPCIVDFALYVLFREHKKVPGSIWECSRTYLFFKGGSMALYTTSFFGATTNTDFFGMQWPKEWAWNAVFNHICHVPYT